MIEDSGGSKRAVPFVNVSGETIPAFAVMAVTGTVHENGIAFLQCGKPSTTLARHYAVNNVFDVAAGLRGTCFRGGELRVLYDGGTPGAGEGWGAKPGQWSVSKGFPGFTLQGVVDATHQIAKATFEPLGRLLAKTTAVIGPNATTQNYRLYVGALGSESDAGFTTVPQARNRSGANLASGEWVWLSWTNNGWELRSPQNRVYHVTLGATVGPGGSASVTLGDGRTVSAVNWSSDTPLAAGDKALCWQDFTDGGFYLTKSGPQASSRVWHATAAANISGGASGNVTHPDTSTASATNWSTVSIANGDKVILWQDPVDNTYYCLKGGGTTAPRWFKGTLGGTLSAASGSSASVTTTSALDGGSHPGAVSAANTWRLSGQNGSPCLIVETLSGGSTSGYELVQVLHTVKKLAQDLQWDGSTLSLTKQDVTVLYQADPDAPVTVFSAIDVDAVSNVYVSGLDFWQEVVAIRSFGPSGFSAARIIQGEQCQAIEPAPETVQAPPSPEFGSEQAFFQAF